MATPILEVKNLVAGYRDAVVLQDVSLQLDEDGKLAILGRNGVGKTTLLLAIMGLADIKGGSIIYRGQDITRWPAHRRALAGLGWVPQEREIFPTLTVEENLVTTSRPGRWDLNSIYELFPRLLERRVNKGNQLSGGEQQMLAFGRTLMTNPTVLLLDEPLEGLAPVIVEELTAAIARMMEASGMGLVLVEQHTDIALEMTEKAIVIERGRVAYAAGSLELSRDQAALDRYVGLAIE
jgi:branched-chain amino acid transport system ATP-binding protein